MKGKRGSTRRHPFWYIIKCLCIILIVFILLAAIISAELLYRGIGVGMTPWEPYMYMLYDVLGLDYQSALDLLKANYAVIIAVVSVMVAVFPFIISDHEKKFFGIQRYEFEKESKEITGIKFIIKIVTCIPILLLLFILMGWCVAGYALLLVTMLYMIAIFGYYIRRHNDEEVSGDLAETLYSYTGRNSYIYSDGMMAYRAMLEEIGIYLNQENSWHDAVRLFRKLLAEALHRPKEQSYVTICLYVQEIYKKSALERPNCVLDIYNVYLEGIVEHNQADGESDMDIVLLWAVLSGVMEWATLEHVIAFLKYFCKMGVREERYIERMGTPQPWEKAYEENAVIAIFLESWMLQYKEPLENTELKNLLAPIYDRAYVGLKDKKEKLTRICVEYHENIFGESSQIRTSVEALTADVEEGTIMSMINTVLTGERNNG